MDAPAEIASKLARKPAVDVAVVVVSYNTRELLLACLASVVAQIKELAGDITAEVVVVDNASSDGSAAAVNEAYRQARLIANAQNLGFAAACNQGFAATTAPFILLLNSDARLSKNALRALYDGLRQRHRCGAASGRLLDEQGDVAINARNFLTPCNQAFELLGIDKLLPGRWCRRSHTPRLTNAAPSPDDSPADAMDCGVDWLDGACLLLRRAALTEVGVFDERFFMYSEDEDLCYRLRQSGWQVCRLAATVATHIGGASSAAHREAMLEEFYASQLRFLAKHRSRAAVALYKLLMRVALRGKGWRRSPQARAALREHRQALHRAAARDGSSRRAARRSGRR